MDIQKNCGPEIEFAADDLGVDPEEDEWSLKNEEDFIFQNLEPT